MKTFGMNKQKCCDECFMLLGKKSTYATKIWLELCDYSSTFSEGFITEESPEVLAELELYNYIKTREISQTEILIKPLFCSGLCHAV